MSAGNNPPLTAGDKQPRETWYDFGFREARGGLIDPDPPYQPSHKAYADYMDGHRHGYSQNLDDAARADARQREGAADLAIATELTKLIARAAALENDIMALKCDRISEEMMDALDNADSAAGQVRWFLRACVKVANEGAENEA